jgi:hypothetical protein
VQYLNDQLEEYKHTEEKLHKMENAIEKYKKRLEDGADLRRQIKVSYAIVNWVSRMYRFVMAFYIGSGGAECNTDGEKPSSGR